MEMCFDACLLLKFSFWDRHGLIAPYFMSVSFNTTFFLILLHRWNVFTSMQIGHTYFCTNFDSDYVNLVLMQEYFVIFVCCFECPSFTCLGNWTGVFCVLIGLLLIEF